MYFHLKAIVFAATLFFFLICLVAVGQPGRNTLPHPPLGFEEVAQLENGRQKLIEVLRYTRNPTNINEQSIQLLDESIAFARTEPEGPLLPELITNKALIALFEQRSVAAIQLLDEAADITARLPEDQQLGPLNSLGIGYRRARALAKSLQAHERHNAITQGDHSPEMVMHRIANIENQFSLYHIQGEITEAKRVVKEMQQLMVHVNNPQHLFNIKFNLATNFMRLDELADAAKLLNELMPDIERNAGGRAPRFYDMIGEQAMRVGQYTRSADFYAKMHQTKTANPQQRLRSAAQLVRLHIKLDNRDSVEKYMGIHETLRKNPVANYGERDQWLAMAQYQLYRGDADKAKAAYLRNIQTPLEPGQPYNPSIFQSNVELADVYHRLGVADSANHFFAAAAKHMQEPLIPQYLKAHCLEVGRRIRSHTASHANADSLITELAQQLALKDSIYDGQQLRVYADMESKYRLHEKEQQLLVAEQRQAIQLLELNEQRQQTWILVLGALIAIVILATVATVLWLRRKQIRIRHQSEMRRQRLDTAFALKQAQEQERKSIANKLHDDVGAMLSIAKLNINQLEQDVFVADSDAALKLQTTQQLLGDMSETVRNISHTLMPIALEKYGLKAAILDLVNAVNVAGKIKVEEVIEGLDDTAGWSDEFRLGLYRIVQEILNNIIKHAQATHVLVQIVELDSSVTVYMEDNGKGLVNPDASDGVGLKLLKSNIEYLNGAIEINGRENQGTFVLIELPFAASDYR